MFPIYIFGFKHGMEVLPTENRGTLSISPVDTSDTVELGFLTAVTNNLSFFRNMMQYSVVLSAVLKDDTSPASHLRGPGSIAGEFISDLWWKK